MPINNPEPTKATKAIPDDAEERTAAASSSERKTDSADHPDLKPKKAITDQQPPPS
jgi:hypothetical protein